MRPVARQAVQGAVGGTRRRQVLREAYQATAGMATRRRFGPYAGRLFRVAYHRAAEGPVATVSEALAGRLVCVP